MDQRNLRGRVFLSVIERCDLGWYGWWNVSEKYDHENHLVDGFCRFLLFCFLRASEELCVQCCLSRPDELAGHPHRVSEAVPTRYGVLVAP
jgi:hypothetical protein